MTNGGTDHNSADDSLRAHYDAVRGAGAGPVQPAGDRHDEVASRLAETQVSGPKGFPQQPPPGVEIEGYEIVREIQRGGQGVIYQAIQKSTKRKVAIKVLLEGPHASKASRRRFEREIELVAQLKHPNIISVYHTGATTDGHPYYVMDYVRGTPLTTYVRDKKLTLEDALRLIAETCEAVQFAHQRGIIHRDLKPANILVDSDGHPKILDFGFAKWMAAPVETIVSVSLQVVGTLPYMSPEVTRGNPDEIDTRTDIYALGVILYEVLTGHYPYPVSGPMAESLRHIAETPPLTVSRAWDRDVGITTRSSRSVCAGQCPIDGELQTVVMKTLSKERERRYQSAGELARDIGHYLAGEPIEAKRDSGWYVLSKTLKRYKVRATVAAAFVVLISTATVALSILYNQKSTLLHDVQQARRDTEREANIAQAVNAFLNNDLLAAVAPEEQGKDITMRQVLDVASRNITDKFQDQPLVAAAIHTTLGNTYLSLGHYDQAEPHLLRALALRRVELDPEHAGTLDAEHNLARLYRNQGRYDDAEKLYVKILAIRRRSMGEEHSQTLDTLNSLATVYNDQGRYDEAEDIFLKTLEIRRRVLGEEDFNTLRTMNNLANVYEAQGRYDEAEPLLDTTLRIRRRILGEQHSDTLSTMNNLANVYDARGHYDKAEPLYAKTVEVQRRVFGDEHPDTLASVTNLAVVYMKQGRFTDAEPLCAQTLDIQRRVLGEEHPETLRSMSNLAVLYQRLGQFDKAEPLCRKTVQIQRRVLGAEHPRTLRSMSNLGNVYSSQGRYDEAEPLYVEMLDICRRVHGAEHSDTLRSMNNLGDLYTRLGRFGEAESLFLRTLEVCRRVLGEKHSLTLMAMYNVPWVYEMQGRYEPAEPMFAAAVTAQKGTLPPKHPLIGMGLTSRGLCLTRLGRFAEAEPVLVEGHELLVGSVGPKNNETIKTVDTLIELYDAWGKPDQAAEWKEKKE